MDQKTIDIYEKKYGIKIERNEKHIPDFVDAVKRQLIKEQQTNKSLKNERIKLFWAGLILGLNIALDIYGETRHNNVSELKCPPIKTKNKI